MPHFGSQSRANLATCHPALQRLMERVVLGFDCKVTQGWRGEKEQNEMFEMDRSQRRWPDSEHNHLDEDGNPQSLGIDVVPYPVQWPTTPREWYRWYYFAGYVMGVAAQLGIPLRSGLDWDMDTDVLDQKFNDGPHFELIL